MTDKLPGARAALVDKAGVTTPPFYRYFQALERLQAGTASAADVAAINAQIAVINAEIAALPKSSYPTLQVSAPLTSAGLLKNGFAKLGLTVANSVTVNGVALQLSGDAPAPGNTCLYSTSPTGAKGWNALGGMLAGATNNIAKTVNADGTVTFDLAPVADSGAGTFKLITRDSFGRVTGTKSGTTSDVPEGTGLYFTAARVLATALSGLSTATNAAITAADSVLSALGKLQAQISAKADKSSLGSGTYTPAASAGANLTGATGQLCRWMRYGNTVFVAGRVDITCTAAGAVSNVNIAPPVASNFTDIAQMAGAGTAAAGSVRNAASMQANTSTGYLSLFFAAPASGAASVYFSVAYDIV